MLLLIILLAASPIFLNIDLLLLLTELSQPFHEVCAHWIPRESPYSHLYAAMICGAPLNNPTHEQNFRAVGLIHLMVVSGAHLLLIEALLRKIIPQNWKRLKSGQWLLGLLLLIYCLMARGQPPVVRALVQMALRPINHGFKLFWSTDQIIFVSGTVCLLLFPQWWNSLSLQLSWGASLALSLVARDRLQQSTVVFMGLIPLLLPLGCPSPLTVLCNWLFAPWLSAILFPGCLLTALFPLLTPLMDVLWQLTLRTITLLGNHFPEPTMPVQVHVALLWAYIFAAHGMIYLFHLRRRRNSKCAG